MQELYDRLSAKSADICGLILTASGLPFRIRKGAAGYSIWVDERHYHAARQVVARYFAENRLDLSLDEDDGRKAVPAFSYAGIWPALLLAVFYFFANGAGDKHKVWAVFGASAEKIVSGGIYRTVTALMLHADLAHLSGNMAGLALFSSAVFAVSGWGVGSLMILASGVAGNWINALVYGSGHLSIGASTAVFGAIGILSGIRFIRKRKAGTRRFAAWFPIAGGISLLAMLGAGLHVDITAHFFGFVSGILIGVMFALAANRKPGIKMQALTLAMTVFIIIYCWYLGLSP